MFTPNLGRTLTAAGISRLGVGRIEADRDLPTGLVVVALIDCRGKH